ncbi:MAG TPA: ABC transporter permease [Polyangiaceae bacterium]|nr:ABC transporter permease [Polyangiaceae bacterium]
MTEPGRSDAGERAKEDVPLLARLAVRRDVSASVRPWFWISAFLLPLALWCIVSYVPAIWHPLVLVSDAGDTNVPGKYSYIEAGQRVDVEEFSARNAELSAAHAKLATGHRANPIFLPAPHEVARAFVTAFSTPPQRMGDFWLHESLLQSCKVIFWGFVWSALFGIPIGILCGTFPPLARLTEPFIDFVRYMPAPVFGALAVAVLGLGDEPKITIIFIGTFFQMVLVVANTTRAVDTALIHAAQTLGASNRQLLFHVVVPAALPNLYRDMRILVGWAWTYLVVAELIGEKSGISAFLYQQQRYRNFENVYAGIVMIGIIGLATDQVFAFVGRYLFPWETGNRKLFDALGAIFKRRRAALAVEAEASSVTRPA